MDDRSVSRANGLTTSTPEPTTITNPITLTRRALYMATAASFARRSASSAASACFTSASGKKSRFARA